MKGKFLGLFIAILAFSIVLSCKKTSSASSDSSVVSTSQTSSGSPAGTFNGVLVCSNIFLFPNLATGSVEASFYSTPIPVATINTVPGGSSTVSSVSIGTVTCIYDSAQSVYFGGSAWSAPASWNVNGAGVIPSFSFSDSDPLPTYGDAYSLPQTIHRSQNLVIPINNLSNADQITFVIWDNTGKNTLVSRATPASGVTFLKDSLNKLVAGGGSLQVYATKYSSQTFGGKNFLFATVSKTVINTITLQ